MEIGERIKIVRDEIGLTQSDFASKIGIGQAALSALEKGVRSVTDRNIDLICREYSVSPDWLRTGEGDMFVQSDDSLFDRFIDENGLDALDAAIIRAFVKLPPRLAMRLPPLCARWRANAPPRPMIMMRPLI